MRTQFIIFILIISGQLNAQQPKAVVLGSVDFYSLINSVPVLQVTPEAAYQYVCNSNLFCQGESQLEIQYEIFNKRKELYASQFEAIYGSKVQAYNTKNSADNYKKQANQNDLIQQMGGIDKIGQMSDDERQKASKSAMASKASSSKFGSFSEAELQRMSSDPEYAKQMMAKYKNMTKSQKEDLINGKIVRGEFDDSSEAYQQRLKDKQIVKNTQDINLFVSKSTSRLSKAIEQCSLKIYQAKSAAGNHEELDESYQKLFDQIPLVVTDEGKYKEPGALKELNIDYALKHKKRSTLELSEAQIEYKNLETIINEVIADYRSFLAANGYRVDGKIGDIFEGANTELSLMQLEKSILGSIDKLADISGTEDKLASKREQHYQLILSGE